MGKIKLKGFEASQNKQEYNRLLRATGGKQSPYYIPETDIPSIEERSFLEKIDKKAAEELGRKRVYDK
ncbi:MAG: hypothetical protein JW700_04320 [Candidatus Aenigmarchaeota archaeon]|nr:hypothetical protein [Candidatus Aenigmarchaeota archaeon]